MRLVIATGGRRSARRNWRSLRRLLFLGEGDFRRALTVAQGAERATCESTAAAVAFVRGLSDAERRELAGHVREAARKLVGRQAFSGPSTIPYELRSARVSALRAAGAGCFTGADATAAWLARRDLEAWTFGSRPDEQTAAIVEVLRDRDPHWLADVARRLAGRLRAGGRQATSHGLWEITAALVRHAGIDPPATDGFVYGWALACRAGPRGRGGADRRSLLDRLRDDPYLDVLSPRLFEVDEVSVLLARGTRSSDRLPAQQTWWGALARLAEEGRLDRAVLLDRCLGRLLRGGRPARLAGFLALHAALDPDLDELAARARSYQRLLPDAPPAVAEVAQRVLRRLDEAGRLDLPMLLEASRAVLFRTERKLVGAQLAWLDAAARRCRQRPEALDELLGAVAVAFAQDASQPRERALSLVRRHARHASAAGRAALLDAGEALPQDLRQRLADALGAPPPAPPEPAAGRMSSPAFQAPAPRALPPPVGTPAELAEELAALLEPVMREREPDETLDPVALERVLAALVAFAHADRAALHEAIAPVLLRYNVFPSAGTRERTAWAGWAAWLRSDEPWYWYGARMAVGMVAAAAAMSAAGNAASGKARPREVWLRQILSPPAAGTHPRRARPRQAIIYRLREIATGLLDEPVPTLLATPATAVGHVDPATLADKLAHAEGEGWQPWELDLQQALLRLPRSSDPTVLERVRRLRSPAGQRLAEWLETGGEVPRAPGGGATRAADGSKAARATSAGGPLSLADLLLQRDLPEHKTPSSWWELRGVGHAGKLCWPSLLPSHRDVIAAHLLPALSLLPRHSQGRRLGAVLPLLGEADGPVGTALTQALAYGLGARDRADRAAAADALLILAGRGQLDGAPLGQELASLVTRGLAPVQRLVEPLRDVAVSGAHPAVWAIVAAMLPRLLPPTVERSPQRLALLLALGAETAALVGASGSIPAVAALAERGGSSQLAAESRRLHHLLTADEQPRRDDNDVRLGC